MSQQIDEPPRPVGTVWVNYNPLQPVFWDLAPHNVHTYVYPDVKTAMSATRYWTNRIVAQRPANVSETLRDLETTLFFRGQPEFTYRLLPTRLRGAKRTMPTRQRFSIPSDTSTADAEKIQSVYGTWGERDPEIRSVDSILQSIRPDELDDFARREHDATQTAVARFPAIAALDGFGRRAAVRHYAGIPSGLMDFSSDIEVSAFFATGGGKPPARNTLGILWVLDLGMLFRFFEISIRSIAGGYEILLEDTRAKWGDNKKIFEDQNIPRLNARLTYVELPLPRPTAQKALFLELRSQDGKPLPPRDELIWWSLFERWAYPNAFEQSGTCYEHAAAGISSAHLLPANDAYSALAP